MSILLSTTSLTSQLKLLANSCAIMPPTLILIRHAEALHNLTKDYTTHDPPLTAEGLEQCTQLSTYLQENLHLANKAELIVTSPMQRTLQTTKKALEWLVERGVPVIALAELQETTTNNIDIGRPIPELKKEWPWIDWSSIDPVFPAKEGIYEFSKDALLKRGEATRKWLRNRPEKVIAVVGHAGFLRIGLCHRKFGNADYRVFEFKDNGEEKYELVESEVTELNGGGMGNSQKGVFGWELHDFKYMPINRGKTREELDEILAKAEQG
ncbi:histidine phosphatase superfamily [Tricladium varicosporioides]|nr:histidine phosphatase superfamily [Hymenoscyphus varicosporioides]